MLGALRTLRPRATTSVSRLLRPTTNYLCVLQPESQHTIGVYTEFKRFKKTKKEKVARHKDWLIRTGIMRRRQFKQRVKNFEQKFWDWAQTNDFQWNQTVIYDERKDVFALKLKFIIPAEADGGDGQEHVYELEVHHQQKARGKLEMVQKLCAQLVNDGFCTWRQFDPIARYDKREVRAQVSEAQITHILNKEFSELQHRQEDDVELDVPVSFLNSKFDFNQGDTVDDDAVYYRGADLKDLDMKEAGYDQENDNYGYQDDEYAEADEEDEVVSDAALMDVHTLREHPELQADKAPFATDARFEHSEQSEADEAHPYRAKKSGEGQVLVGGAFMNRVK